MDDMMSKIQDVLNDEESMNQIKKLAEMFGSSGEMPDLSSILNSGQNNSDNPSENIGFDPSKLLALQGIMAQANKKDQNIDFLYALKPLLKTESQVKVDRISKIFKLIAIWPLIKESGLLGGDLFDIL